MLFYIYYVCLYITHCLLYKDLREKDKQPRLSVFFLKLLSLCLLRECYNLCCLLGFYFPVGFWKFRAKFVGPVPFLKLHSWLHFVLLVLVLFSCFYFWPNFTLTYVLFDRLLKSVSDQGWVKIN